jgi:hypothetical protein
MKRKHCPAANALQINKQNQVSGPDSLEYMVEQKSHLIAEAVNYWEHCHGGIQIDAEFIHQKLKRFQEDY